MDFKCPICGSEDVTDLMYHQNNYKCNECGHLYKGGLFNYDWYEKADYWYKDAPETLRRYQKMFFSVFEDFIEKKNPKKALEVGAADGDFLYHLNKKIPSCEIHYNELVDILRPEYTFISNKFIGDVKNQQIDTNYDLIILNDVIEHFDEVYPYTEFLLSNLNSGGQLFIVTNNGDFLNAHNELIYHQEHLNIFSAKSFATFISDFPVKETLHFNSPQGLSFIVLEKL